MPEPENELGSGPDMAGNNVTVEEAALLFAKAGVPRSPRSVRRYCERGHLQCVRIDTENAQEQYLITAASIDRRIAELKQIQSSTSGVRSSPDVTGFIRPGPARSGQSELVEILRDQIKRKDEQITVKDGQIAALNRTLDQTIERDRETNVLLKLLQEKIFRIEAPRNEGPDMTGHVGPHIERGQSSNPSPPVSMPSATAGL
jgi:hypothetical protein